MVDSLAALVVASFIVIKALAIESTLVIKHMVVVPFDLQVKDFEQLLVLVLDLVSPLVLLLLVAPGSLK